MLLLWAALMALIVGVILSVTPGEPQTTPSSGMRVRSSGTDLGRATVVDCLTGVTCTVTGSVWSLTGTGGGGGAPTTSKYLLQQADGSLPNAQAMGALGTGLVFNTTGTGVQSIYAGSGACTAGDFISALSASGVKTCGTPAGSGTVTHTGGALTANAFILGAGAADVKAQAITGLVVGAGASAPSGYAGISCAGMGVLEGLDASGNGTCVNPYSVQGNLTLLANISGGATFPSPSTLTAILDAILGTTQGAVMYRNATVWTTLAPGTAGQFLQTGGAAANISWQTLAGGGNVSNTGTPTSGQLALWTNATTIQGLTALPAANFPALTGPVTTVAGALGTTIVNNAITTAMITDANVTRAKIVDVSAASRLIGRGSAAGAGVEQEIVLGTNLSMSGTTLNATGGSSAQTVLALTSDATTNSTTTGVEITGLNQTTSTGTYTFQYFIRTQAAATTTGVKFGINHTGTATAFTAQFRYQALTGAITAQTQASASGNPTNYAGAAVRALSTTAPNMGPTISIDAANADAMTIIEGLIIVTVAGDLELWHASEVAAASTVMAGSSLILTKTN